MINQIIVVIGILMVCSCSSTDYSEYSDKAIRADVHASIRGIELYRGNLNNEGGNENSQFEPSEYPFEAEKPNWMKFVDSAHLFLVALISSDPGFNQSNWESFFHGYSEKAKKSIVEKISKLKKCDYKEISEKYGVRPLLSFEQFTYKISNFLTVQ
jgi:hypothetical protein